MTDIRFRDATQADVAAITECIAAAYAKTRETLSDLPDVTAGIAEDIAERRVILAQTEDAVVGVIVFIRQDAAMKIINLAVSPNARGLGIAGQLLSRAEGEARAARCTHMTLRTHRLMQDTRAIYAHLGWVETEEDGNSVAVQKTL